MSLFLFLKLSIIPLAKHSNSNTAPQVLLRSTIMNLTIADPKSVSVTVDHDSRNLAIIYGSLGTLIAFATLVVAVLSWLKSRRQKLAAHHEANGDIDLESNTWQQSSRTKSSLSSGSVSYEYAFPEPSRKTSRSLPRLISDRHPTTSELAVAHDRGHRSPSGSSGSAISPSHACQRCHVFGFSDNCGPSIIGPATIAPTGDERLPTAPHVVFHGSQPQAPFELDGRSILPSNTPERRNTPDFTSICDQPSAAPAPPTTVSAKMSS